MTTARSAPDAAGEPMRGDNEIFLRGRLAAEPETRTLPTGDEFCVFRLTVPRPEGAKAKHDVIDCTSSDSRIRRRMASLAPGQTVEVVGSLHRRFWRTTGGVLASRYEVQVASAKVSRRRSDA